MTFTIEKLVEYRLHRAWETFEDAEILAERGKWNSTKTGFIMLLIMLFLHYYWIMD